MNAIAFTREERRLRRVAKDEVIEVENALARDDFELNRRPQLQPELVFS
jgi:hypothetical protein